VTVNTPRSGRWLGDGSARRFVRHWWPLLPIGLMAIVAALALAGGEPAEDDSARSTPVAASGVKPAAPGLPAAEPVAGGPDAGRDEAAARQPRERGDGEAAAAESPEQGGEAGAAGGPAERGEEFRIAAVRRGARVGVYSRPAGRVIERVGHRTEFGSKRVYSVIARRGGWLRVSTALSANNRDRWIRAGSRGLRFATTDLSIHANLSDRVVQLRRDGRVEQQLTVTIGAQGTPTPVGRFGVTDVIRDGLNPVYGCCAIALSARQPNLQDDWIGGDRIAIHGSTGAVGSASSNGCLRATDPDVSRLADRIPLGTPVFIEN
jgi:hypothetical protein